MSESLKDSRVPKSLCLCPRPHFRKAAVSFAISTHPYITNNCNHATDLNFALNHRSASASEQRRKDLYTIQPIMASSRWNPTPQQLEALEEMYRRGTRTPTSHQIQQIAAQLRRYGKIEGKNVFYWFQNHKARERQKRRRVTTESAFVDQPLGGHIDRSLQRPDSGSRRTSVEVGQTKNWTLSSDYTTLSEEPVSIHRAATATGSRPADGWFQLEEREFLIQRGINTTTVEKHATCQMMELYSSSSPNTTTKALTTIDPQNHSIFFTPNKEKFNCHDDEVESEEVSQTLELFPLRSCGDANGFHVMKEDLKIPIMPQFFEFL